MNSNFVKDFSDRLSGLMAERGFTQQQLADKITSSQTSVSHWLRGNVPSRRALKTLADCFSVNIEWLRSGQGSRVPASVVRETVEVALGGEIKDHKLMLETLIGGMQTPQLQDLVIEQTRLGNVGLVLLLGTELSKRRDVKRRTETRK
ncbi:MAG: helix-turn-helix domain-containing protein [Verrucomicrobia bacterium]|nr:helix-turn-helix domain-containing protein [Verrucomicrobiota bacterium]